MIRRLLAPAAFALVIPLMGLLANPADVLARNSDKRYLQGLGEIGVAIPPTLWTSGATAEQLDACIAGVNISGYSQQEGQLQRPDNRPISGREVFITQVLREYPVYGLPFTAVSLTLRLVRSPDIQKHPFVAIIVADTNDGLK